MADVDVRSDAGVTAFVDKANHRIHVVKEAQTERLQFESDVDILLLSVIAKTAAGFDPPLPLGCGRDDLALPDVFAEHEQNIFRVPGPSEVDEFLAALDVKFADGIIE